MELVSESAYPKVIFECLLDQIEKLQIEKRRLLYGDETGPLDEEIDEHGVPLFNILFVYLFYFYLSIFTIF